MFKRAKVLKVFTEDEIEKNTYSSLQTILSDNNLNNVTKKPNYIDSASSILFKNMHPNTLFCVTDNKLSEDTRDNFSFLCSPAFPINISTPVKEGNYVWYFEDETISFDESKKYPKVRFFWLTIVPESNAPDSQFRFPSPEDVVIQDDNENILSLYKENEKNLISIVSGKNNFVQVEKQNKIDKIGSFNDHASNVLVSSGGYPSFVKNKNILYKDDSIRYFIVRKETDNNESFFEKDFKILKDDNFSFYKNKKITNNILTQNQKSNSDSDILKLSNDFIENPNITLKSSNINIIARDLTNLNLEKEFDNEIKILKESDSLEKESQILLDNTGDVYLDGKTIYIGSFIKKLVEKQIIEKSYDIFTGDEKSFDQKKIQDLINKNIEEIMKLSGNGEGVILGYEKSLTEPLVLGNTLVLLLKDQINLLKLLIKQNKDLNSEMKKMSNEFVNLLSNYANHTHNVTAPGSPSGLAVPPFKPDDAHSSFSNTSDKIDTSLDDISKNLEVVKNSLYRSLSKFSKTS